jgi:hypothetical protein
MSLTGIPSKDDLTALIKQAATEAQASGFALEDHLVPLLHGALLEAAADVSGVLKAVLDALAPAVSVLADLNTTLQLFSSESLEWRNTVGRLFNLSPPETTSCHPK